MSSRLPRPQTLFLVQLALLGAAGCTDGQDPSDPESSGSLAAADTNLLLITLDTIRADRIGAYGHAGAETPRIDELAGRGVRFERAYAQAPITLPTHASLFTGTFPPEHGIHDNGRRALGTELTTLAEIFSEKGFRTGAFVSAIALDGSFGLDRGFDIYDDEMGGATATPGSRLDRPASEVVDNALRWLGSGQGPFFLWAHFYDAHADYLPPPDFRMADPYDGEIAYVDSQISRLLGWLDSQRLAQNTLIVVLADHGESLGEKGEHTHAALIYEGTQRIPWLMVLPDRIEAGSVSRELVQQVDLLPTLMEMYDWSVPEQVSGRSFAPLFSNGELEQTSVFIESEYSALNFGWSSLRGVVHENWKYIQAPTPELYDLALDPGESNNIAAHEPELVRQLDERLEKLMASMRSFESTVADLQPGMAQGLSDLGYVQGPGEVPADAAVGQINPIERIEFLELYHSAVGFAHHGEWERMIAPLEKVVRACPEGAGFHTLLGDAYRRLERWEEAREQLDQALELAPDHDPAHFYLGAYHEVRGEVAEALEAYRRNLDLRPGYVPAREAVARLLAGEDDVAGALEEYEAIVALDPNQPRHWIVRSGLEHRVGNREGRRRALERALELAPDDPQVVDFCAWVLATTADEDLRDPERALALSNSNVARTARRVPRVLDTLAAAQAAGGAFKQAIASAGEALELARALGDSTLVEQVQAHLELYGKGKPVRED